MQNETINSFTQKICAICGFVKYLQPNYPFYAKQTQFQKMKKEHKSISNKALQKQTPLRPMPKQTQSNPILSAFKFHYTLFYIRYSPHSLFSAYSTIQKHIGLYILPLKNAQFRPVFYNFWHLFGTFWPIYSIFKTLFYSKLPFTISPIPPRLTPVFAIIITLKNYLTQSPHLDKIPRLYVKNNNLRRY
jgi:hypothetical protein